jgi:ribonuclease H / adenosylcobalamin/alpha-ribazole phosphatase
MRGGDVTMTKGRVVRATLRFDGGHRRSIDKAAYGFTIKDAEGNLLAHEAQAIGYTTHNVAEYRGMIAGLLRAAEIGVTDLQVWGDSRVVIHQMTGAYQARAEHLAALRDEARRAALKMSVEYVWNRRNENAEADALVNLALDEIDLKRSSERPQKPKPAKTKKSAMVDLSKAKLRSYLLEHITVSDKSWNAAYGAPAREDGESRETYIRRVLA